MIVVFFHEGVCNLLDTTMCGVLPANSAYSISPSVAGLPVNGRMPFGLSSTGLPILLVPRIHPGAEDERVDIAYDVVGVLPGIHPIELLVRALDETIERDLQCSDDLPHLY